MKLIPTNWNVFLAISIHESDLHICYTSWLYHFCRFSMTLRMGQVHVLLLRNQVLINTNMMRWSSNPIKLYGRLRWWIPDHPSLIIWLVSGRSLFMICLFLMIPLSIFRCCSIKTTYPIKIINAVQLGNTGRKKLVKRRNRIGFCAHPYLLQEMIWW